VVTNTAQDEHLAVHNCLLFGPTKLKLVVIIFNFAKQINLLTGNEIEKGKEEHGNSGNNRGSPAAAKLRRTL
jgi:hypothetical protein